MEDGVHAFGEDVPQSRPVGEVADHEERTVRNGAGMPAREVVEDDDVMAAVDEALDARGPDVAGAADDENLQSTPPVPTLPARRPAQRSPCERALV